MQFIACNLLYAIILAPDCRRALLHAIIARVTTVLQSILLPQHNQHVYLLTFRSSSETVIRRSLFSSSSGSCHDSDVTWQEIGRTCGSACSCPRPGSRIVVPAFRICTASLIHLVLLSDSLSKILAAGQLITWLSWDAWSVSADLFCSDRLDARWFLVKGLL